MLKSTRSIKENIIEAVSEIASLKSQIKLLGVAYGSVEELIADLEDFLRRKNLAIYPKNYPKISHYPSEGRRLSHLSNLNHLAHLKKKPVLPALPEEATNFLFTSCPKLSYLLKQQIESTEDRFINEGGCSENLFLKRLKKGKKLNSPKLPKKTNSFTLLELLIVITLIALLALAALLLFNPFGQVGKSWDAKRKTELGQLQKVIEDWYNDKNCYPKPTEICYDSPTNNTCHICGKASGSPKFSPYLPSLPCDPQHPTKKYLYQVDNSDCPKIYRIYADLSMSDFTNLDPESATVGCHYQSCGPPPNYGFDYGISSPNTALQRFDLFAYCAKKGGCNVCGTVNQCEDLYRRKPYKFCQKKKYIIPAPICSRTNCPCQPH